VGPLTDPLLQPEIASETRKTLLVSNYLCKFRGRHPGEQTLAAGSCPRSHRREQAMVLTRLAIAAVLMTLAVPCVRGTLMVLDARRRAGAPAPPAPER